MFHYSIVKYLKFLYLNKVLKKGHRRIGWERRTEPNIPADVPIWFFAPLKLKWGLNYKIYIRFAVAPINETPMIFLAPWCAKSTDFLFFFPWNSALSPRSATDCITGTIFSKLLISSQDYLNQSNLSPASTKAIRINALNKGIKLPIPLAPELVL